MIGVAAAWRPSAPAIRRLINIGHMLTGNFANGGIMLVAVAIAARGLGPTVFGSMVLLLALASLTERLIRFETWQPLIKFAADEEAQASPERMARLYALGFILDIITASLAATITIGAAFVLHHWFGWQSIPVEAAGIYALAMLCNITGSPGAALRMAGRFRAVAYVQVPANLLRAGLAGWCYLQEAGLIGYVVAWTVAEIAYRLATLWLGLQTLKSSGVPNPMTVGHSGLLKDFPGFLPFAWSINLSTMLRTLTTDADELVVGGLAGPAAASMYNLAKRLAKFSQEIGTQVQTVIYPELARMWSCSDGTQFRSTVFRTQLVLGGIGLLIVASVWILGQWLIGVGLGESYLPAYTLVSVQVVAVLFTLTAAPGRSAMLSLGRHRAILGIAAAGALAFYAVMIPGLLLVGPVGASAAHVVLAVATAILIELQWRRHSRPQPLAPDQPRSA